MIRKSKPKKKNIELLNKFLKIYKDEVVANKHIKPKSKI
tara:strand:+ start:3226 stop:3342 length:117 start_codon:yes stop_codon:yes gene_type:complete